MNECKCERNVWMNKCMNEYTTTTKKQKYIIFLNKRKKHQLSINTYKKTHEWIN